jgi:uncharacterized membrane protein
MWISGLNYINDFVCLFCTGKSHTRAVHSSRPWQFQSRVFCICNWKWIIAVLYASSYSTFMSLAANVWQVKLLNHSWMTIGGGSATYPVTIGHGLDDRGSIPVTAVSRPVLGSSQPPMQWVPGRESDHSPPSSAEVKECMELFPLPQYAFMTWCPV